MAHNDAHNALVREALQDLALAGYTAWKNETGVWHERNSDGSKGRPHHYGKPGSGDIFVILPKKVTLANGDEATIGWHVECEAKTGSGRKSKSQNIHQKYCVEKNGGVYILFRTTVNLMKEIEILSDP